MPCLPFFDSSIRSCLPVRSQDWHELGGAYGYDPALAKRATGFDSPLLHQMRRVRDGLRARLPIWITGIVPRSPLHFRRRPWLGGCAL